MSSALDRFLFGFFKSWLVLGSVLLFGSFEFSSLALRGVELGVGFLEDQDSELT